MEELWRVDGTCVEMGRVGSNCWGSERMLKRDNYGESIILRQRCVVLTKLGSLGAKCGVKLIGGMKMTLFGVKW